MGDGRSFFASLYSVDGGLVVWPESPRPGALTEMRAADAATGRSVAVPPALRTLGGVSGLATDGRAIAYPNEDYTALSWSPSLETAPRRLYATGNPASHLDNSVQVAGSTSLSACPRPSIWPIA